MLAGAGESAAGGETLAWAAGDVLLLPGGAATHRLHTAARLWLVTDEPLFALTGAQPGTGFAPVHYRAAEIAAQLALIQQATAGTGTAGHALIFATAALEASRNLLPTLTLSLNTLPGEACHSVVGGQIIPWENGMTLVTPPGAPHSHYNGGRETALFLIVQDGGLHYQARTMDFAFLE